MNNILTYTLNLNGNINNMLQRVGVSADQTTRDVNNLDRSVNNLNKVNLSGFFSTIGKIASIIGIGTIIGKTIKAGMEQEMRNTSFEVLFGGVDNAKKMIDEISGYAAKSPYGKAGLSDATQMMAGFGIAQEQIMPNLKMIGDIAMGDADKFKSLTLAFSQMSSTGKLTGQDLLQMINAQFNPLTELEKMTGKTTAQLKDMMSKGLISSDMVAMAFQNATKEGGLYYGMIDKINGTVSGQWATAMDNIAEKLLNLYFNVFQPFLLPALKKFNQFLTDPIETIQLLISKIMNLNPILLTLGAIILTVAASIGIIKIATMAYTGVVQLLTFFKGIETAAWWANNAAMLANPVTWIVAGVIALIAVIAFLIIKIDGWDKAWEHTVNGCKLIWQSYTEFIKSNFNTVVQGIMIGINKIKEGWYSFKEAVGIGDSSANQKMLADIHQDTEARKKSIVDGYKKTADLAKQAGNEFKDAAGSFSWNNTTFSDVANNLKNKLGIAAPGVPGTNGSGVAGTGGLMGGGTGSNAGKDTANSIATGGSKTTHITINLGELVGSININKNGFREAAENMRDIVLDEMTRVLSMAQGQTS